MLRLAKDSAMVVAKRLVNGHLPELAKFESLE